MQFEIAVPGHHENRNYYFLWSQLNFLLTIFPCLSWLPWLLSYIFVLWVWPYKSPLLIIHIGTVPVKIRGDIVDDFNRQGSGAHIMLLSLGAGGVGLNLVGANHLFLLDMHWNPQLEQQVQNILITINNLKRITKLIFP